MSEDPEETDAGNTPGASDDAGAQHGSQGVSLDDQIKPYSNVLPWKDLSDETKAKALAGLKTFHGAMTRGQQEAAALRRANEELSKKAQAFDLVWQNPAVQEAYRRSVTPGPPEPPPQQADLSRLSEFGLDNRVGDLIRQAVRSEIQGALGQVVTPLQSNLNALQAQVIETTTSHEFANLAMRAKAAGLPDPYACTAQLNEIIAGGRARTVRDAYNILIGERYPELVEERLLAHQEQVRKDLEEKAKLSIGPGNNPALLPANFRPPNKDPIWDAIEASQAEMKKKGRG